MLNLFSPHKPVLHFMLCSTVKKSNSKNICINDVKAVVHSLFHSSTSDQKLHRVPLIDSLVGLVGEAKL